MKRHYYFDIVTRAFILLLFAFFLVTLLAALFSCRTQKETTTEVTRTEQNDMRSKADTLIVLEESNDSVVIRDSIFTLIKGDSVFVKEYHYRERTQKKARAEQKSSADSVWKTRTIIKYRTRTKKVEVEVEKRLPWWKSLFLWSGVAAWTALVGWGVFKLRKYLFLWRR